MNTDKTSRSFRLVIIEIILMLGVFAAMSVIIVRLFVSADHLSKEARDYSQAVIQGENLAELLKGSDSFEAVLSEIGMEKETDGAKSYYHGYYGHDWNQLKDSGFYEIKVDIELTPAKSGVMEKARIEVVKSNDLNSSIDDSTLCSLNVNKFIIE